MEHVFAWRRGEQAWHLETAPTQLLLQHALRWLMEALPSLGQPMTSSLHSATPGGPPGLHQPLERAPDEVSFL